METALHANAKRSGQVLSDINSVVTTTFQLANGRRFISTWFILDDNVGATGSVKYKLYSH